MKKVLMVILTILTIAAGVIQARRGGGRRGGGGGFRSGRRYYGGRGYRRGGYWGRGYYPYWRRRYYRPYLYGGYPWYYPYSYGYGGPSYYQSDAYVPLDQLTQFKDRIKFLENFTHRTQNQQNELQHLHARVKQLEEGKAKAAAGQATKRIAPAKEPEKAYVASKTY